MNTKPGVLCGLVLIGCLVLTLGVLANWSQSQKITSTPRGAGAQFGNAVAISGNTMVVGARFDGTTASQAGAAYVFVMSGGAWTQQAVLLASDGAVADRFGSSVAISQDTVIVGAVNADPVFSNAGAAYVFVRSGTTWTQQQKLTASDGTADDLFGSAAAITGDIAIVGANHADLPGNSESGAVYVFQRTGTVWAQTQRLSPSLDVVLGDHFGDSVAMSGNKVAIGASGDDTPATGAGAVYVFASSGGATYALEQKLTIPGGNNGDQFGFGVAFDGTTIVGGATENTAVIGQPAFGAAYVFTSAGSVWSLQQKLTASDGASGDRFGYSVAVSANTVAVGARQDTTAAGPESGSAYVFTRIGSVWTQRQKLAPADAFNGDRFGVSAAFATPGLLAVGAAEKALSSPSGQGAVYTFLTPLAPADFDGDWRSDRTVFRPSTGVWYSLRSGTGTATATAWGVSTDIDVSADYDGDGKADLAIFRPSTGQWWILQSSTGTVRVDTWGGSGDIPMAGDVDGDGKADLVIWRPDPLNGIWYVKRSSGGFTNVGWGVTGDTPLLADVDGDGKMDFVIYRPGSPQAVWYVLKSGGGVQVNGWGTTGDIPVGGDFDGDGKADPTIFRPSTGQWWILKTTGGVLVANWGAAGDVPISGDQDGDGKSDFIVWRPSTGVWYTQYAAGGSAGVQWGVSTDKPVGRVPGS